MKFKKANKNKISKNDFTSLFFILLKFLFFSFVINMFKHDKIIKIREIEVI